MPWPRDYQLVRAAHVLCNATCELPNTSRPNALGPMHWPMYHLQTLQSTLSLQVGDVLLAMDGVDLTEGLSLKDVLDPRRSPHQLIVCRRDEVKDEVLAPPLRWNRLRLRLSHVCPLGCRCTCRILPTATLR